MDKKGKETRIMENGKYMRVYFEFLSTVPSQNGTFCFMRKGKGARLAGHSFEDWLI